GEERGEPAADAARRAGGGEHEPDVRRGDEVSHGDEHLGSGRGAPVDEGAVQVTGDDQARVGHDGTAIRRAGTGTVAPSRPSSTTAATEPATSSAAHSSMGAARRTSSPGVGVRFPAATAARPSAPPM